MKKVRLGSLVDIQIGKTPSRNNPEYWGEGVSWLSIADLGNLNEGKYITKSKEQITDKALKKSGFNLIPENTILFSFKLSIGKVAITKKSFYTNEAIAAFILKPDCNMSVEYLFYALKNLKTNYKIDQGAKGGTLNKKSLANLMIHLPDRQTQNKIVAVLDRIYFLIVQREKSVELFNILIKSTFLEYFGSKKKNAENWKTVTFKDIIKSTQYGTASQLRKEPTGTAVLRMNNISYNGDIDLSDLKWVKLSESKINSLMLNERDLLFNRTNSRELVGKTAVWDKEGSYIFAGYLIRITFKEDIANPYFVSGYLNSEFGKKILYNYAKSSGNMTNFSPPLLEKQKIFLPNPDTQKAYEDAIKKIKYKKEKIESSLKQLASLLQSVMQNIFSNEDLISEEIIFEDLLKNLEIGDFLLRKERVKYLANLINRHTIKNDSNYQKAKEFVFQLLEITESGLKQYYNPRKKKNELINC